MVKPTEGRDGATANKTHRHTFRLTESQNTRFLNMMMQAGVADKSRFIVSRLFG